MKILLQVCRVLVGLLFIFSGLVKANDPLGLSYKMQEFFEVWGWQALNGFTLAFALIMNFLEIVAGVALLVGWRIKPITRLLVLMIVFFTFLTGYALFSGKFRSCGCFGDCIPISPMQSFIKDLLLVAMIVFIYIKKDLIKPLFPSPLNGLFVFLAALFSIALQRHVLKYLPVVDCLPYKQGNNIIEKMKIPEGARPDSFAIAFVYKKDGKAVEFDMNNFPDDFNDSTYSFVERKQVLVKKGTAQAAIVDFSLANTDGTDTTLAILNQGNHYVMLFVKDANTARYNWVNDATLVAEICAEKNIPFFVVTATLAETTSQLFGINNIHYLKADGTVIKTAARVNPTYFIMHQANIAGKYSDAAYADLLQHLRRPEIGQNK